MKNHGNDDAYTRIGRYLCLILRHKPEVIGITLDRHGWADVDKLRDGFVFLRAANGVWQSKYVPAAYLERK